MGLDPREQPGTSSGTCETTCARRASGTHAPCSSRRSRTSYGGEDAEARRLEERALELAPEGFGTRLFGPRVRLALLRNQLGQVEELLDVEVANRGHDWMVTSSLVTSRLDALLALGRHEEVEEEAGPLVDSRSVLRPFAQRALALVREDDALLAQALAEFERLGLDWHAAETRKLVLEA